MVTAFENFAVVNAEVTAKKTKSKALTDSLGEFEIMARQCTTIGPKHNKTPFLAIVADRAPYTHLPGQTLVWLASFFGVVRWVGSTRRRGEQGRAQIQRWVPTVNGRI